MGIDKLTYRHGLALQDRGINAQYIDASAHCEVIFKSKHARKSHIPVTVIVNLSIPTVVIIGGVGYWHFDSKYRGLDDLKAELGYNSFERSKPDNPFADHVPENNRLSEIEKRKAALAELDRRYLNRREVFSITAFIAGSIAILVLLWNIIWHTGHWIWMGRKVK